MEIGAIIVLLVAVPGIAFAALGLRATVQCLAAHALGALAPRRGDGQWWRAAVVFALGPLSLLLLGVTTWSYRLDFDGVKRGLLVGRAPAVPTTPATWPASRSNAADRGPPASGCAQRQLWPTCDALEAVEALVDPAREEPRRAVERQA